VVAAAMESQNLMMPEMREPEQGIPQ
jgi:hypothetical protein